MLKCCLGEKLFKSFKISYPSFKAHIHTKKCIFNTLTRQGIVDKTLLEKKPTIVLEKFEGQLNPPIYATRRSILLHKYVHFWRDCLWMLCPKYSTFKCFYWKGSMGHFEELSKTQSMIFMGCNLSL